MIYKIKVAGREIELAWTQETAKRYAYRLSAIGGQPTQKELSSAVTASAALCKLLWALLPKAEHARYETPEDLFVAIDEQAEGEAIAKAIVGIFSEMAVDAQKKMSLMKSLSQKSS
jgi:hypothetical protein